VGGAFRGRGHPFVWRLFVRRKICKAQHWDQKPVSQDPPILWYTSRPFPLLFTFCFAGFSARSEIRQIHEPRRAEKPKDTRAFGQRFGAGFIFRFDTHPPIQLATARTLKRSDTRFSLRQKEFKRNICVFLNIFLNIWNLECRVCYFELSRSRLSAISATNLVQWIGKCLFLARRIISKWINKNKKDITVLLWVLRIFQVFKFQLL